MRISMAACMLVLMAGAAQAKTAKCELTVDGQKLIDGKCEFTPIGDGDGSFIITGDNGYFAYANRDGSQMRGSWNGLDKDSKAHWDLGMLDRDGACWVNRSARVCAW